MPFLSNVHLPRNDSLINPADWENGDSRKKFQRQIEMTEAGVLHRPTARFPVDWQQKFSARRHNKCVRTLGCMSITIQR
jgi:hypothetical protein